MRWKITICIVIFIAVIAMLCACQDEDDSTKTNSSAFIDKEKKIAFLDKYLVFYSEVLDAEYDINFLDGGADRVPTPSEWTINVIMKVRKESVSKWVHEDYITFEPKIETEKFDYRNELNLNSETWKTTCKPEYYKVPGGADNQSYMMVYADDGIIYKFLRAY